MEKGRTLKELNVQSGDVVMTAVSNGSEWVIKGKDGDVYRGVKPHYRLSHPGVPLTSGSIWRIVSRATPILTTENGDVLREGDWGMLRNEVVVGPLAPYHSKDMWHDPENSFGHRSAWWDSNGQRGGWSQNRDTDIIAKSTNPRLKSVAPECSWQATTDIPVSSDSPIRLVEKAEIVPGVYGRLKISKGATREVGIGIIYQKGLEGAPTTMTAKELRETIATLQAILPVLEAE